MTHLGPQVVHEDSWLERNVDVFGTAAVVMAATLYVLIVVLDFEPSGTKQDYMVPCVEAVTMAEDHNIRVMQGTFPGTIPGDRAIMEQVLAHRDDAIDACERAALNYMKED